VKLDWIGFEEKFCKIIQKIGEFQPLQAIFISLGMPLKPLLP